MPATNRRHGRGNRFMILFAVLATVTVGSVIVAISVGAAGGNPHPAPTRTTAASHAPAPSSAPAAADRSSCGLAGFDSTADTVTAPKTGWVYLGLLLVPDDRHGAGPGRVDEHTGFRSCYAHTVDGALVAAANYTGMTSDAAQLPLLLQDGTVPGPGRDAALQKLGFNSAPGADTVPTLTIAGFRILDYTASQATVELALQIKQTGTALGWPVRMRWVDGDWKIVLTDTGDAPLPTTQNVSLADYTAWAGQH